MKILFTVVECPLGWLLVATTSRGICSVMLGDNKGELINILRNEFPQTCIEHGHGQLLLQVKMLVDYLEGRVRHLDLALDARGTAFQQQVWKEMRRIPRGQKISYSELAKRIGKPKAIRAVAGACAANPVAILTPCHRVVGKDGSLAGYRWGIDRKRWLLEHEVT